MKSNWSVASEFEDGFGEGWGYSNIVLQLLWNRGLRSRERAEEFLNPSYAQLRHPHLFPQMERAIERIFLAKERGETVFIYGDYDADGVSGAVILHTVLGAHGIAPKIYIPHLEKEGYGLNAGAIDYMKAQGAALFITCDCGISNNKEIAYAKNLGIDALITDHHALPQEISSEAYAIVHPAVGDYPFKELSGGGVAFKLAQGIIRSDRGVAAWPESGRREALEKWLLDLAAISTVGDMVALQNENRVIVYFGLKVLNKTKRLGLRKLIEAAGLQLGAIDAHNIGFQIAPRINAAGRMDHANAAFRLLISENEDEARQLAENLNKNNSDRQKQTDIIVNEAKYQIVEGGKEKNFCLFAFAPDWPLGLLGLAAGKIAGAFNRPTILMTEVDGVIKGSARNADDWNIIAALERIRDLFSAYGGHPAAAGMTLKDKGDLKIFEEKILALAKEDLRDKEFPRYISIDAETDIDGVNLGLCEELKRFEPFGEANPRPLLLSRNLEVRGMQVVGNGTKHLRLTVAGRRGAQHKMIGFCMAHWCEALKFGDRIDAVYEPEVNNWNGRREVQMKIVDLERIT